MEVWNSFAGIAPFDDLKPVKKFTNRQIAVRPIWQAVARLSPAVAQQAERVAPSEGKLEKASTKSKKRATAQRGADEVRMNKRRK